MIVVGQKGMWAESSSPSVGPMGQEIGSCGGRQSLLFFFFFFTKCRPVALRFIR